ncbi:hypothetical protein FUA23_07400 [Neolewinella aurantiaca]|uniref:Uncharacterized protein n=1 Tax=Neolewinella aurantiaca TaxID=2602767 RepID=A0A5C7FJJ9_9BACT|nr:hypothetical protein [Neolewinella aurantiaca]TXF90058.1 hypothetical protein FUA23_07400 [Neolewinella aurantiaca]
MAIFPDIELIGQPGYAEAIRQLSPNAVDGVDLLIVYDSDYDFLERVLAAAGYDDPKLQLHLLEWSPAAGPLDLTGLIRHLKIKRVLLFGQDMKSLGLHFQVADYFPVEVGGVNYMRNPSAATISEAKNKGDNGPAGALWRGVKASFMKG